MIYLSINVPDALKRNIYHQIFVRVILMYASYQSEIVFKGIIGQSWKYAHLLFC